MENRVRAFHQGVFVTEIDRTETLTLVRFPDGYLDWIKTNEITYMEEK